MGSAEIPTGQKLPRARAEAVRSEYARLTAVLIASVMRSWTEHKLLAVEILRNKAYTAVSFRLLSRRSDSL